MDSDDLDRWLDEDRAAGALRPDPTERRGDPPAGAGDGQRWPAALALAAVLGVVGTGVLLVGREADPAPPAVAVTGAAAEAATGAGAVGTALDPTLDPADVQHLIGPADMGAVPVATDDPVAPSSTGAVATPDGVAVVVPAPLVAGAVAALRARLTVPGDVPSYLEWATPVRWRPLDAGMSLVVLDAIWLDGADGDLTTARRGRWGVVLGDDGAALAAPWLVAGPPATTAVEDPPPTGSTRLSDVTVGMQRAGWRDVTAVASDPHPLLAGVLVALIEGVPPGSDSGQSAVVWLQDTGEHGLTLLGAPA